MNEIKVYEPNDIMTIDFSEDIIVHLYMKDLASSHLGWIAHNRGEMQITGKKLEIKVYTEELMDIMELVGMTNIINITLIK